MSAKKRISRIVGLTSAIVKNTQAASSVSVATPGSTPDEIARLWNIDYTHAVRACFSRAEVREIVGEGKRQAWPHLNEDAVRLGSTDEFARRAYDLGADFQIANMPWPSGLSVMGFYLGKDSGLEKRPLICVNGAHHPAAIATAFLHEVGHHVTADLFSVRNDEVQHSKQVGYAGHLTAPRELAADVLVSLGIYPQRIAAKMFGIVGPNRRGAADPPENSPAGKAVLGTARRYGLDLETLSIQKRLQYQAGLIHFTRLRQTLLEEYGF
jgi:hypothetical protein